MDVPDGLSSRLENYMKNNEEVPENVIEGLQRGLRKPRQELADLQVEIKELGERLSHLKKRRDQVQKHIAQYDCVFSPIRRTPTDILHHIFYHCLPPRRDPIMSATEAPLLLTRVCRAWRLTAYTSPPLWARLYITFSDEDSHSDSQTAHELTKQYVSNVLHRRCNAVGEWLSRSGACPLSISISYTSDVWISTADHFPGNSENTLTLFRTLARFSSRWQNLQLKMPIEVYRILEAMVPLSQLSVLTSLKVSLFRQVDSETNPDVEPDATFLEAPNLTTISLTFPELWKSFKSMSSKSYSNLMKLTNLSICWCITASQAVSLLKDCPNLEFLSLTLVSDYIQAQGTVLSCNMLLSLPHLRAISIVDSILPHDANNFYDCIDAPRLKWFNYKMQLGYGDRVHEIPVIALLKKLTELKKLTIEATNSTSTVELQSILQNTPSITHLVFGPETRANDNSFIQSPFPRPNNPDTNWNLGDVFLRDISFRNSEGQQTEYTSVSNLLPNLEVLEVSQTAATRLGDKALLDIILSRMDPTSPNKIALLRKVVVLFTRPQGMNISEEVMAHSEQYGHRIELDIQYVYVGHDQYQSSHFVSPGYGVDPLDRSWHYKDLAEDMAFSQIG